MTGTPNRLLNAQANLDSHCPRCRSTMVKTNAAGNIFYCGACGWEPPRLRPEQIKAMPKIGRNDPCPCGSGNKFKKCCGIAWPTPELPLDHDAETVDRQCRSVIEKLT